MSEGGQLVEIESVPLSEIVEALRRTHPFAETSAETLLDALGGLVSVERVTARAGAVLMEPLKPWHFYWLVLDGETRAVRVEQDGSLTLAGIARAGGGFGEAPFLTGKGHSPFLITATRDSLLLRFAEEDFWKLLACCASVVAVVLADMAVRLQAYQVEALHREKLVSLGTLAAGLMHELHNPGSAAKRAASQLRTNLLRLQELSLSFCERENTPAQLSCMQNLQKEAISHALTTAMSSLEQSDAEEEMAEWLETAGVANAYKIAPSLVGIGLDRRELECTKEAFANGGFSD